jgi:hypothetical protein
MCVCVFLPMCVWRSYVCAYLCVPVYVCQHEPSKDLEFIYSLLEQCLNVLTFECMLWLAYVTILL